MIYELIAASLLDKDYCVSEREDWADIYTQLNNHVVSMLCGDMLSRLSGIDPDIKKLWKQEIIQGVSWFYTYLAEQNKIVERFQAEHIPFVIIKGCASAMYYPRPEYRIMGDIDLLVRPEDYGKIGDIFQSLGYSEESIPNAPMHGAWRSGNVTVEPHWSFDLAQREADSDLNQLIFSGFSDIQWVSMGAYQVPVLPKLQNGIVILEHIRHHLSDGVGLRQILDWMMYVHAGLDDRYWTEKFQPVAKKLGLEQLAVTVTHMIQMYFHLDDPEITWCNQADDEICEQLMQYISTCGNMGRNRSHSGRDNYVRTFFETRGGVKEAILSLQKDGEATWKALEKHPWLKPVAWIYRIFRSMKKMVKYKVTPAQLIENDRAAQDLSDMLSRLNAR